MARVKKAKTKKAAKKFITAVQLQKQRGRYVYVPATSNKLELGKLNEIFGCEDGTGFPVGKIAELSGDSSAGKSTLCFDIACAAQACKYTVLWVDFENSFTPAWAAQRGVNTKDPLLWELFSYELYTMRGKRGLQYKTAEEMCDEVERYIRRNYQLDSTRHFLIIVDSVAALEAGSDNVTLTKRSLHTQMSLPKFLGDLTKRWLKLAATHQANIIFVNQLRQKPSAQPYEDPKYTPGGNAIPFYSHVRARMRRVGFIRKHGKRLGVKGIITLKKSKLGREEATELGYKLFWRTGRTRFCAPEKIFVKES